MKRNSLVLLFSNQKQKIHSFYFQKIGSNSFITFLVNFQKRLQKLLMFYIIENMRHIEKILEIEALTENLTKHLAKNNLLKIKVLYFISQYENLSVSMIIDKLGLKKSNFALMAKDLEKENLVFSKQGEIDKRCRMMFLTEKGKDLLSSYLSSLEAFFSESNSEVEHALETLSIYLNKKI